MPTFEIKHLYHHNRFPKSPSKVVLLLLYAPVGVVLCFIRTVLALSFYLLSFALPNIPAFHGVVHRLIYIIFGIIVNVDNIDKKEDVDAFISNKVSYFDAVVINSLTKCVTPGIQLNNFLSSALHFKYFGTVNDIELKTYLERVLGENRVPIYFQPESIITNGKVLLKFSIWPFVVCDKVQPITIRVSRPGLGIPISTINSTYWGDLFYFMFVPCTVYNIKYLSAIEKKGLTERSFMDKVRENIATELKIGLSDYSASDLQEYIKRYRIEQQRNFSRETTSNIINPETHRMLLQVQEVLPLVPHNVIYKDLVKTQNVDQTITNILEGHVSYIPEQLKLSLPITPKKISNLSTNTISTSQISHTALNTAALVFGKSPQERNLSFQERKRFLIENCRKRYIEKRGLNIVNS